MDISETIMRFKIAFKGISIKDKCKLSVCAILESFPFKTWVRVTKRNFPLWLQFRLVRISNIFAENCIVKLDNIHYVLVDSYDFYMLFPTYETKIMKYLNVRDGDVFLDIGAHIGLYSLRIAKNIEKSLVVAVEASKKSYDALKRGVALNKLGNVILFNVAGWFENVKLKLNLSVRAGMSSLKQSDSKLGYVGYEFVTARRLDELLEEIGIEKVDYVKIDVEGAELEVLRGLEQTLIKCHPVILFENWGDENLDKFLRNLGYNIKSIDSSNSYAY